MRLYQVGDSGEPVRDIQDRLTSLGYPTDPDHHGEFAQGTRRSVIAFQRSRKAAPDGIIGPETWRALYEAGYRLGDRSLYLRRPMFRGDDVAELQRRLNDLGFDAGKVDGIFGSLARSALIEFQRNRRMAEDGIMGPRVLAELRRVQRNVQRAGREAIREREWLRRLPTSLVGTRLFIDPACRSDEEAHATWPVATKLAEAFQILGTLPSLSREVDVFAPDRVRALHANRSGAQLIVCLQVPTSESRGVYYFASALSHSEAGAVLAATLAAELDLPATGRSSPMLKDTRAPAVVVSKEMERGLVDSIVAGTRAFFRHAATTLQP